jgi:hypothetical protein
MNKTKKNSWTQIGMITVLTSLSLGALYGLSVIPKQAWTIFDSRFAPSSDAVAASSTIGAQ